MVLVENGFYFSQDHGLFYFPLNKLNGHIEGEVMKQFVSFLVVTLAFTALQVVTVEAQEGYPDMESPMCDGEPCDPVMALEGDETDIPPVDASDTMAPEGDYRRLPAPEDMGKFFEYDQEYRTNGILSQASYDDLSEDGYTKKRVDWILTQIKAILQGRDGG